MFQGFLYLIYAAFPIFAAAACLTLRPYFQNWKHPERWSCLAGTAFAMLAPAITQPVDRLPFMLASVALAGLITYGGILYVNAAPRD